MLRVAICEDVLSELQKQTQIKRKKETIMSKLRYHIAVMAAKFSKVIIRLSGRNGTHTPGVVARKICPDFMAQAPKAPLCICVTDWSEVL